MSANSKVSKPQGGASIEVASGGAINLATGAVMTVGGVGVGLIRHTDVTLTAAQILALNATPQTLVAAPGAGLVNVAIGFLLFLDYNSAAYSGVASGEDLAFKYTDGSGAEIARVETDPFLTSTADALRWIAGQFAAAGTAGGLIPVANAAIVAHLLTGEVAAGNSPITIRTFYMTLPSTLG